MGVGVTNGGQGINDGSYTFQITPATGFVTSNWGTNMNAINRVNRILERIKVLEAETKSTADLASLKESKATLLAFRAYYAHYKLFAYYTADYTNLMDILLLNLISYKLMIMIVMSRGQLLKKLLN